jgi:carbamoyltransferase
MTRILGISCYYHDSAACLVEDGVIVAAAQEERFTRKKHDAGFPRNAVRYCLAEAGVPDGTRLNGVAFYDKPLKKFHRILETYFATAPKGLAPYLQAVPLWLRDKLWIEPDIQEQLLACGVQAGKIWFPEHHESHAASAFFASPFQEAAVMTLDGVGEWATSTIGIGEGNRVCIVEQIDFPHSLGLLYSAFTYFTGFKVNSGEYKLMGLAPYGEPTYRDKILSLMDLKDDGSFRLDMSYFGYIDGLVMTGPKFDALFGGPARKPEERITRREMDLARSIQDVCEEVVIRMARHARKLTGKRHLCMAGGVALNCVANGKLLRTGIFDDIWIQPAAGDAGGSVGAALATWHHCLGQPRHADGKHDAMQGAYLGPEFADADIQAFLDARGYPYERLADHEWAPKIAQILADQKVVGMCQGRMEFGPRALGNRSILGDARSPQMQSVMNLKIKYRESFRPFAPSCLEERVADFFELDRPSPYMLLVADVVKSRRVDGDDKNARTDDLLQWVNRVRSDVPAVTHVDDSARIQTVNRDVNPRYWALLKAFEDLTGYGILINTSFNVRGEPIVCTPEHAYKCFMRTEMDALVLGSQLLLKTQQPKHEDRENWKETFTLD